jgi:molybdate transport system substrate-binding protein
VFTTNVLEIAVEAGNPLGITGLRDLGGDVVLVVCDPAVPCGRLAAEVLDGADVEAEPVSLEENVKAVLTKVELGEADAGIVYASDVATASEAVEGVAIPAAENAVTEYPIGVVTDAENPDAAAAWIELVQSAAGQQVLADAGFGG